MLLLYITCTPRAAINEDAFKYNVLLLFNLYIIYAS